MTFDACLQGYYEQKDEFLSEHQDAYNKLYDLNLDLLGLTPDDERKDLLNGIGDYTYLTMINGMDMFADALLGMICDKYPVIGLKIKNNKKMYEGSNASDNPGAKKVQRRSRRPKKEPTQAPTSSLT